MRSAILIAVLAAGLLAIPPAAAAETGDVALTSQQEEDFREAAAAAGLSTDQIEAALADPAVLAVTPVYAEVEVSPVEEVAAMPSRRGLHGTLSHSSIRGRSRTKSIVYRTFWGSRLFSFTVHKYWEYDGRRVTSAPAPRVWGNVTTLGSIGGWEYRGVVGSSDHYFWHHGRWHGGHTSFRQGKFTGCALRVGCINSKHPRIEIRGYYDGGSMAWGS